MPSSYRTRQTMFNTAVRGLAAQGRKSERAEGACLYRGPNGTKCAIGMLIADEDYRPVFEGCNPLANEIRKAAGIRPEDTLFACELQSQLHDDLNIIKTDLPDAAAQFAKKWGLKNVRI